MMLQWHKFRSMYSEDTHVLAFRMGDFYEFFNNDARVVAKLLDITCTTRQEMPLAGFPYASGHESLEKIVQTGLHVIVVDQVEDPEEAKARGAKVVERGIVRIISPGTVLEETILDRHANNYLCSFRTEPLKKTERYLQVAIAICDLSTGEFFTTSFIDATDRFSLLNMEMLKLSPVEIVIPEAYDNDVVVTAIKDVLPQVTFTRLEDRRFDERVARETMLAHFDLHNLEGLGIEEKPLVVSVAGALVTYLRENQKSLLSNITACRHESPDEYMHLDHNTIRNLELVRNHADGSKRGTLLGLFSKTVTPMGTRHMKQFLLSPLLDREKIEERLDVVERLHSDLVLAESLRDVLGKICDLERLITRINYSNATNARHLVQLGTSLSVIPAVDDLLSQAASVKLLAKKRARLVLFNDLTGKILRTFVDEPPPRTNEGGMIREGINAELDELRDLLTNIEGKLQEFQDRIEAKHGLRVRVKNNKVFGYFIEVSKGQLGKVPEEWIRKQTLTNAERFINEELKTMEDRIVTAEERIHGIEKAMFDEMREAAIRKTREIQQVAKVIAEIDVLMAVARVAASNSYVRPVFTGDATLRVIGGRHPTIEQLIGTGRFIPNDLTIDPGENVLNIVTGPNMSGKSTFLRQVCLIVLLAQAGSFVPASTLQMGIVDKIFSRVGAMDDITRERSTFMVEMNETAFILNHATERSLVILDELGRGTSTFDGVSLAWAVAEYLHAKRVKTLFATHYHQLADLELSLASCKNLNVVVREDEKTKELIFLHEVKEGSCDKSYGIQVARLAGLPARVVERAAGILEMLTSDDPLTPDAMREIAERRLKAKTRRERITQTSLFVPVPAPAAEPAPDPLLEEMRTRLKSVDITRMTPLDAMNELDILKKLVDGST